jgi:hypothetical protein
MLKEKRVRFRREAAAVFALAELIARCRSWLVEHQYLLLRERDIRRLSIAARRHQERALFKIIAAAVPAERDLQRSTQSLSRPTRCQPQRRNPKPGRSAGSCGGPRLFSRGDPDSLEASVAEPFCLGRSQPVYRAPEDKLIPQKLWQRDQGRRFIRDLDLPASSEKYLQRLEAGLSAGLAALAEAVEAGAISIDGGELPLPRRKPAPKDPASKRRGKCSHAPSGMSSFQKF